MRSRLVLALVVAVLTVACGTKPDTEIRVPTLTVEEREAKLKALTPWRALGSIAVESEERGKFHASFSWDVDAQGYEIKLFGPLGVQAFQLIKNTRGAVLIDRKDQVSGDSAEQLLQAVLGVPVPIGKMQVWAVGLPGGAEQVQRDKIGRLSSMVVAENTDAQWKVNFERYTNVDNMDLPKTVLVDGDGIKIKLSFKKWLRSEDQPTDRLTIPGVGT